MKKRHNKMDIFCCQLGLMSYLKKSSYRQLGSKGKQKKIGRKEINGVQYNAIQYEKKRSRSAGAERRQTP